MKIKRTLLATLLAVVATAVSPAAVASEVAERLIGRWMLMNQADALQIEFHADGSYKAFTVGNAINGKWALVDDKHLATWVKEDRPKRVNRFSVDANKLVITDERGVQHVHERDVYYQPKRK